mmetsp:Transcript_100064/g.311790  ORF Transcript_100064/g.311790 Transcript_100064/m.311790 type:complete len:556 (-) Transcript_100064:169-1836(-)
MVSTSKGFVAEGFPEDRWVSHYSVMASCEMRGDGHSAYAELPTPSDDASLLSDSGSCDVERPAPSLKTSWPLRDYSSVGAGELVRWLWLDYSKPARSRVARQIQRNLRRHSSDSAAADAGSAGLHAIEERQESVGLARLVSKVPELFGEGSLLASVFTLVSSAMGAGCLSLPFMLKRAGVLQGLLMLVVGACLAHISLVVLMSCARYTQSDSMARLVALAQGGGTGRVVDVVIAVYGIAAVLCYTIFIGDFFSGIARAPPIGLELSRETLMIVISAAVVWPLSLPRDLSALCYVCVLSVSAICLTAVAVACKAPSYFHAGRGLQAIALGVAPQASEAWQIRWWSDDPYDALHAFSISLFAFAAHTNAVPVATAMKKADGGTIWRVSFYSVCIELLFYSLMGLGGYLSFREHTQQDFILNYPNDDMVMFSVRCVYGVVVCLGAPINLSPAASSIVGLISQRGRGGSPALHFAVVTTVIAACVGVAIANEGIADVIGLIGSSFGSLIVLAWPAMIYRRALSDLHPCGLARFVYCSLGAAALLGFAAFSVQAYSAWHR